MKKNILILTLVAALGMLGACSSDNNGNNINSSNSSKTISGNFAKEPISNANLEIWNLGEVGVNGKTALDKTKTAADGSFKFTANPTGVYVVKVAKDGLADARVMNKAGGELITNNTVTINGFIIDSNSAIIVPANSPALLNPLGILATQAAGIPTTGSLSPEGIANANVLVENALNNIYSNLSAMTLATVLNGVPQYVSPQTLASVKWSANQEFAIQLALILSSSRHIQLADLTTSNRFNFDPANITPAVIAQAQTLANDAAAATSQSKVSPETVNPKEIVRTFLLNYANNNFPEQINATNTRAYSVEATAFGANASVNLEIVKTGIDANKANLIPATSVDATTITPSDKGITAKTGKTGNNFGYDIKKGTQGAYSLLVRATYDNGTTTTNTKNELVLNLNATQVLDDGDGLEAQPQP